jgi:hypothetical protein
MCYAKPGPRCSAHAAEKMIKAKRNMRILQNDKDLSIGSFETLQRRYIEAEEEFDATPAGKRQLQRQIRDSEGRMLDAYRLRLERGVALRKAQLVAINSEDKGDVVHEAFAAPTSAPSYSHWVKQFPADNDERPALKNSDPKITDMLAESREWLNSLTVDEIEAVSWYTGTGSLPINTYVATGSKTSIRTYNKSILEKTRSRLDSAFRKVKREEPIMVYRGIAEETYYGLTGDVELDVARDKILETHFQEGSTFSSPTYMSATIDPKAAQQFGHSGIMLEILSKKAVPVSIISLFDVKEREMVIPRNQKYKVHRVIRDTGVHKGDTIVQLIEI